jgi:elongin-C
MATPTEYVTLVSSDGFSFVVQRSAAYKSMAIQRMLDPQCEYLLEIEQIRI